MSFFNIHVPAPGTAATPWCGWEYAGPDDVTATGVVGCKACISLLCEHPQYYNRLRVNGLRTLDEENLEKS